MRYLTHLEMERVSAIRSENPETLDSLEVLANVYDRIRDQVDAHGASDLNFSNTRYDYRLDQFEQWLTSKEDAAQANVYWLLLQQAEAQRRNIQVRFSPWLIAGRSELATALLSELARALGQKLGPKIQKAFASLLSRLGELAPVAGAGIDLTTGTGAGKIVSAGITWSGKAATSMTYGPTLEELREKLRSLLRALTDKRVVVVIDDLDRLTPNEAREMVGLVKSLGDLPNVIYLLSYDENNLAKLISDTSPLEGHSYLKKIVQYPIHLPPISKGGLAKIFDADLTEILSPLDDDQRKRIGHTWHYAFRHYLNTGSVALDLLTRVRELAHDGEIWAQSAPAQLLWFWWGANYEAEVKTFTTAAMEDETGLQNLLVVPISLVRSSSGDYEHVSPTWSYIVDLEALAKKANQLIKNGTTAEQQAAHRFIAALNRGADGPFRS
jgi:hypothetical protein